MINSLLSYLDQIATKLIENDIIVINVLKFVSDVIVNFFRILDPVVMFLIFYINLFRGILCDIDFQISFQNRVLETRYGNKA